MGLAPSDEPSSQDHPPQRPIDNDTFYGKMLSGLNAARCGALELPTGSRSLSEPGAKGTRPCFGWQYRSSGGAKSASVKICMWIVGTIILTIGVAWCNRPRYRRSDCGSRIDIICCCSAGWYFMGAYEGE